MGEQRTEINEIIRELDLLRSEQMQMRREMADTDTRPAAGHVPTLPMRYFVVRSVSEIEADTEAQDLITGHFVRQKIDDDGDPIGGQWELVNAEELKTIRVRAGTLSIEYGHFIEAAAGDPDINTPILDVIVDRQGITRAHPIYIFDALRVPQSAVRDDCTDYPVIYP